MRTFYIPTSTLNFNNILSTESISPRSFYASRGFGIPRWVHIEANRFNEAITLYDIPHQFNRPQSDVEDHPMLIEVETSKDFEQIQDGVYISRETIYLNPWHTKFIFFSEAHKRIALMLYESSFEAKLLYLYSKKIIVDQFEGNFPSVDDHEIAANQQRNKIISVDQRINKLKGLLYGYHIGAMLSSTPENISRLSILLDINNILNSILTNPSRVASASQRKRLCNDLYKLQFNSGKFGILMTMLNNKDLKSDIMKSFMERPLEIFRFCASSGLTDKYPDIDELLTNLKEIKTTRDNESANQNNNRMMNPTVSWVKKNLDDALAQIKASRHKPSVNELCVSLQGVDYIKYVTDVNDERIYLGCINDLFLLPSYRGNISSYNAELADRITDKVKDILGDQWHGSKKREYLNKLRRHIAGEDFPCDWNNKVLPSLAAVLLHGDDWERLLRFMQSNGMNDYRLAFSIYGVLQGFANLLRDFTDILIMFEDKDYVASVYSTFHEQLFGDKLPLKASISEGSRSTSQIPAETSQTPLVDAMLLQPRSGGSGSSPTPNQSKSPLEKVCSEVSSTEQTCQNSKVQLTLSPEYISRGDVIESAINFVRRDHFKNKDKLIETLRSVRNEMSNKADSANLLDLLKKDEMWAKSGKPGSAWKRLYQYFSPDGRCPIQTQKNINSFSYDSQSHLQSVTSMGSTGSLLMDTSWIEECANFIKGKDFNSLFKRRSKSLVNRYNIPDKKYDTKPKDNKSFRKHLENSIYCYYSKEHQELRCQFNEVELKNIINYLAQNYGD